MFTNESNDKIYQGINNETGKIKDIETLSTVTVTII